MDDRREWTLTHDERPWTANMERRWHHMERARTVRAWRDAWGWRARAARIPQLSQISIVATPLARDHRWRPDVAACYPAVKAAIDGLVDAGVIPDDTPDHLVSLMFMPVDVCGRDGLTLVVREDSRG